MNYYHMEEIMAKSNLRIGLLLSGILLICTLFVSCGISKKEPRDVFVGEWEPVEVKLCIDHYDESTGEYYTTTADVTNDKLKNYGTVSIRCDGTLSFMYNGIPVEAEWEYWKNETETKDGEPFVVEYANYADDSSYTDGTGEYAIEEFSMYDDKSVIYWSYVIEHNSIIGADDSIYLLNKSYNVKFKKQ